MWYGTIRTSKRSHYRQQRWSGCWPREQKRWDITKLTFLKFFLGARSKHHKFWVSMYFYIFITGLLIIQQNLNSWFSHHLNEWSPTVEVLGMIVFFCKLIKLLILIQPISNNLLRIIRYVNDFHTSHSKYIILALFISFQNKRLSQLNLNINQDSFRHRLKHIILNN